MEPWQSWLCVGAVAGGVAYYYTATGQKKRLRGRGPLNNDASQSTLIKDRKPSVSPHKKENGNIKKRKDNKKTNGKATAGLTNGSVASPEVPVDEEKEEEIDEQEFARQLNNAQVGTSLQKPAGPASTKKNKKKAKKPQVEDATPVNGHANESTNGVTRDSSTTGPEDDFSSATSPDLVATSVTTPSGHDVSDMLEAPAKGPSVLRLTEPLKPQKTTQAKSTKVVAEAESKKQRQRRKRKEEEKAGNEAAEKERRVLLEKQLRTAREAEGRPARNGLQSSQAPGPGAWNKATTAVKESSASQPSKITPQPLLDTFDDTPTPTHSNVKHSVSTRVTASSSSTYRDLPSEEEQLRIISELESDNTWNTVDKGGKAKRKAKMDTPTSSQSERITGLADPLDDGADAMDKLAITHDSDVKGAVGKADETDIKGKAKSQHTPADDNPLEGIFEDGHPRYTKGYLEMKEKVLRYAEIAKKLDRSVWNHENIHEHPDYDPEWPFALVPHPLDSVWHQPELEWFQEQSKKSEYDPNYQYYPDPHFVDNDPYSIMWDARLDEYKLATARKHKRQQEYFGAAKTADAEKDAKKDTETHVEKGVEDEADAEVAAEASGGVETKTEAETVNSN